MPAKGVRPLLEGSFAELDEAGWLRMADDVRDSHRADMHQVLAYAALFAAPKITTTLVCPLRPTTFAALRSRGRDVARAELFHGGRRLTLQLQGLPFREPGLSHMTLSSRSPTTAVC